MGWLKCFCIEFKAETGANYSGKHFWAEQCVHVPLACLKLKLGPFTVGDISGLSMRYCVYAWPSMGGRELCSARLQS